MNELTSFTEKRHAKNQLTAPVRKPSEEHTSTVATMGEHCRDLTSEVNKHLF